jgi:hypothetical protein
MLGTIDTDIAPETMIISMIPSCHWELEPIVAIPPVGGAAKVKYDTL